MITGNEPAMPIIEDNSIEGQSIRQMHYSGLTIRQQFAAMAMQGMLSNSIDNQQGMEPFWHMGNEALAESAVGMADALINELNKTEKQ